jgi:hypothetical protein
MQIKLGLYVTDIDLKYFYVSLGENGACDCPQ